MRDRRIVNGVVEPRPYVPKMEAAAPDPYPPNRPWLRPMLDETNMQRHLRLNHTCYACGQREADLAELDRHEREQHDGRDVNGGRR